MFQGDSQGARGPAHAAHAWLCLFADRGVGRPDSQVRYDTSQSQWSITRLGTHHSTVDTISWGFHRGVGFKIQDLQYTSRSCVRFTFSGVSMETKVASVSSWPRLRPRGEGGRWGSATRRPGCRRAAGRGSGGARGFRTFRTRAARSSRCFRLSHRPGRCLRTR